MKRRIFTILAAVLAVCLTVFSGCGVVYAFEKDLTVVLKADGKYLNSYTVNIFNNAVINETPEPENPDWIFLGWTAKEDYIAWVDSEELLIPNKGLVRYDDVKDYVKGNEEQVTLYAVFGAKPVYDLVIGWYGKSGTSGVTQEIMDKFTDGLWTWLNANGYDSTLRVDIREYSSTFDVATVGSAVNADGDVDVLVGMGSNITTQGGIVTKDLEENYEIGVKPNRNIARLSDDELAVKVFEWMKTDEARALFK